ncbi:4-hydroxy-3-methylbut-2-enyl diphosphate reductase, chloroplastic-like [Phragmites australis]|uniref:4-hydroxy-3-methylbut-2-enyl diphosphate reductase, chloroplastic-like n=1 Tax=Phragmites australis TaxID=29695 RepID=UPI002D782064|nr:4-hydroxy-3-methylbut-2-enyl diphosphate reductase, chloroplastic-like [Phragmites australis]
MLARCLKAEDTRSNIASDHKFRRASRPAHTDTIEMAISLARLGLALSPSSAPGAAAFSMPSIVRCGGKVSPPPAMPACPGDPDFDKKAFSRDIARGDNYNRKGFGHKEETVGQMNLECTSKK